MAKHSDTVCVPCNLYMYYLCLKNKLIELNCSIDTDTDEAAS